jgi:hypothetical protein
MSQLLVIYGHKQYPGRESPPPEDPECVSREEFERMMELIYFGTEDTLKTFVFRL